MNVFFAEQTRPAGPAECHVSYTRRRDLPPVIGLTLVMATLRTREELRVEAHGAEHHVVDEHRLGLDVEVPRVAEWTAARMAVKASGSWMAATTRILPPQYGHRRASMAQILIKRSAQLMRPGPLGALSTAGVGTMRECRWWCGAKTHGSRVAAGRGQARAPRTSNERMGFEYHGLDAGVAYAAPCLDDGACEARDAESRGLGVPGSCKVDSDCDPTEACKSGVCQPKFDAGHVCLSDDVCARGDCSFGVCSDCDSDADCSSSQFCHASGVRAEKFEGGHLCLFSRECLSGNCASSCRPWPETLHDAVTARKIGQLAVGPGSPLRVITRFARRGRA